MKVIPWIVTYNGMGTGPSIKQCAGFLLTNAPSFGSSVTQIEIYAHCRTRGRAVKNLDFMRDRFRARVLTLPKVWFRRKRKLIEVAYFSRMWSVEAMFGEDPPPLDLRSFRTFCQEFGSAMLMIEERVRPADNFNLAAFRLHVQERLSELPEDEVGLHRLQAQLVE